MSFTMNKILDNKPFNKMSYIAMLLGFYPINYTMDYREHEIIYGEKLTELHYKLIYLKYLRLLKSMGVKDLSKLQEHFSSKDWANLFTELGKYNIDKDKVDGGVWNYFKSYSLENNSNGFHGEDVKHRLYLNVAVEDRAFFAKSIVDACVLNNIPYYFKVFTGKDQTDTIVLYFNNEENLLKTAEILNNLINGNERLKKGTRRVSPHLYRVTNYIGYGSEPPEVNGERYSYTQLMKECAYASSDKISKLKRRIFDDFDNGRLFRTGTQLVPSRSELINFRKLNREEKSKFFHKYLEYLKEVYGSDMFEITGEIEERFEKLVNTNTLQGGRGK